MLRRNALPTSGFFMVVLLALATVGVGYGLWSKVLTIEGTVNTGDVNAKFDRPFTDDDDVSDDPLRDAGDNGNCPIGSGSCDPKVTGAETAQQVATHRYDKGVARCEAGRFDPDELQAGQQGGTVDIRRGYPSYHCTAWFPILNNGTIPLHLAGVMVEGKVAVRCETGETLELDLDEEEGFDIEVCVSGLPPEGTVQIHPENWQDGLAVFYLDLDIHVMQDAQQNETYEFDTLICLHQWNEAATFEECVLAAPGING